MSQNGGVGLYVKNSLVSNSCEQLNFRCEEYETIWVEVENRNDKNFLFCCAYRHPNSSIDLFTSHLQSILPKLLNKQVFIMGDFNINLLNYDTHTATNDFANSLFSNNFLPCINQPTRISAHSSTLIDNIFTNLINATIVSGNILTQISDHLPQFLILQNVNITQNKSTVFKSDYSNFNEINFVHDFNEIDFGYLNEVSNIDSNYGRFLKDIVSLVEQHVPTRKCSKKESKFKIKPWITKRIQRMIKTRDSILRRMKKKRSASNVTLYKKFRNRVANELKESKQKYFQNYFTAHRQNMKQIWSGIKTIISHKSYNTTTISKIMDGNGEVSSEPNEISNIFNDHFVNVANSIAENIPKSPKSALDYLRNKNPTSIFLSPVTHKEIEDIISNLDSSKSIGPFSIPINLLKILKLHISHPLSKLINESFLKGVFPSKLKIAKVIPLLKQGDPKNTSNYRPISLLPVFSKLYEKVMYKRLYSFVTSNKIIHPLQFGFQENHSVDHALISITEAIRNTLDDRKYGCGVFIDLQKAFDTANHDILLSKLEHYGIRGTPLKWFKSYLSDRYQYVSVNGEDSNLMKITCGVPQGSVLGPLLFLLFINDLPYVSKKLNFYLFADDTNIYYESESPEKLAKK